MSTPCPHCGRRPANHADLPPAMPFWSLLALWLCATVGLAVTVAALWLGSVSL